MPSTRIASRIERVVVYRSGARVTRCATLAAGPFGFPESVELCGLPLSLDDGSLKVSVAATAGKAPLARDVVVRFDAPGPDPSLPPPDDDELDAASLKVTRLDAEIERIESLIESIAGMELNPRPEPKEGEPPVPSPAQARIELLEFRRATSESLAADLLARNAERDEAEQARLELAHRKEAASAALSPREHELRKSAVVRLESPAHGAGSARIEVEYVVPGASWAPAYSLAFDRGYASASLAMRAAVCQRSGEDWDGVSMTLSTAEPLFKAALPKLPASRIGRTRPEPRKRGWREPPAGLEALFADFDAANTLLEPSPGAAPAPAPPRPPEPRPKSEKRKRGRRPEPEAPVVCDESADYFAGAEPAPAAVFEECCVMPPEAEKEEAEPDRKRSAPPSAAYAPAPARMAMRSAPQAPRGGSAPRQRARIPSEEVDAPADLLDFANLRMSGPEGPGRGRLRALTGADRAREMLGTLGGLDPERALAFAAGAFSAALSAMNAPLPKGYARPQSQMGFDSAYSCEGAVSVPSDGAFHSIAVTSASGRCSMKHVCVPRESTDVFRFATVANPLAGPVLPGPADVYVVGEYLMSVPLEAVGSGGNIEVGLGVEEGIKAARNASFNEESSGLLGGRLDLVHRISVELANNLGAAAQVEVRERVPVARDGDNEVEVHVAAARPQWTEFVQSGSPGRGLYCWNVRIEPSEKAVLEANYEIRISSKKELSGGNRREF